MKICHFEGPTPFFWEYSAHWSSAHAASLRFGLRPQLRKAAIKPQQHNQVSHSTWYEKRGHSRTPLNVSTTDIFNPTRSPFTANHNFLMYVMYKPKLPNSCYVPLVNVSWSWGGTAEANLLHSSWTLKSSHSSTSGTGIETDSPPNWSSIYTNGN